MHMVENAGKFDARYLAFLETISQLRPQLHRYCARMTGSITDGEDVVRCPRVQGDDLLDRKSNRSGDLGEVIAVIEHRQDHRPARLVLPARRPDPAKSGPESLRVDRLGVEMDRGRSVREHDVDDTRDLGLAGRAGPASSAIRS